MAQASYLEKFPAPDSSTGLFYDDSTENTSACSYSFLGTQTDLQKYTDKLLAADFTLIDKVYMYTTPNEVMTVSVILTEGVVSIAYSYLLLTD